MRTATTLPPPDPARAAARPGHLLPRLCAAIGGIFASYLLIFVYLAFRLPVPHPFGDFFALWSYAQIAASHGAALLYDPAALHAAQVALGMDAVEQNPYPYPPTFRLLLWPLQFFGYWPALVLWLGGSFLFYLSATVWGTGRRPILAFAAALAPTTAITLVFGQGGFLVAGLLVGGARLAGSRPVLAGVLFGLLTYKPQFGLMVPVALLAAGQWRCIAATCATALAFAGLATAAQGWSIWPAWLAALPGYQAWFDELLICYMPTIQSNAQALGAPLPLARAIQALATLGAAATVWVVWRRRPPAVAVPVLLVATCVATPHAFIYDLPLLTAAAVLFMADRLRSGTPFAALDIAALLGTFLFPAAMVPLSVPLPIAGPMLLLLLAAMLRGRSAPALVPVSRGFAMS